jgi:tetratricopeptide (TPR) repeat protein
MTTSGRAIVVSFLAVLVLAAGSAQTPAPAWLSRLSSWLEAVKEHRPGQLDMAARIAGLSTEGDLQAAIADYLNLVVIYRRELGRPGRLDSVAYKDTPITFADLRALLALTDAEAAAGNANRILLRAATLHADVAMLVVPTLPGRVGCSARGTVLVKDGNSVGRGCICFHWSIARALLDAVRPAPGKDAGVRLWYQATITWLLSTGDFANADLHIPHAQFLLPDDVVIRYLHGRYHEAIASPVIQPAALDSGTDTRGARVHLEEAAEHYRQALRENPHFVEARVHRGFVLLELSHEGEAAGELRRAAAEAQGTQLRYYAELFLGRAEAATGNDTAAREHFTRAAELYPQAQSPRLALAILARDRAERDRARRAMQEVLSLRAAERDGSDPWWDYLAWQNLDEETLRAELYRLVAPEVSR